MVVFEEVKRNQAKIRLAITGPSGAGKTIGSLRVARGLVGKSGKIAVADSERGSAQLYEGITQYSTAQIDPPYTVEKYIDAIQSAENAGFDVIILDSISHVWNGNGGLLQLQDEVASRPGYDKFRAWGVITPQYQKFVDAMMGSKIHVIATMRSKTEYTIKVNEKGKNAPQKLGLSPIQRDGIDYEFTTVLDLGVDHFATATKDRTGLFDGKVVMLSEEVGEGIIRWIQGERNHIEKPVYAELPATAQKKGNNPASTPTQKPRSPGKRIYQKHEVDSRKHNYIDKNWDVGVFDRAKISDDAWDADMVDKDFEERKTASKSMTLTKTMTPTKESHTDAKTPQTYQGQWDSEVNNTGMGLISKEPCERCGKKVLVKDDKHTKESTGQILCKDCHMEVIKERSEKKEEVKEESNAPVEKEKPKYVCGCCGVEINKVQADVSKLFVNGMMCKECMDKKGGKMNVS